MKWAGEKRWQFEVRLVSITAQRTRVGFLGPTSKIRDQRAVSWLGSYIISRSSTLPSAPTKALSPVRRKGTNQGGRGNGKGWAKRKEGGGREKRGGRDDRQEREGREKRRRGRRGREREEEGKEKGKREGRSKGKEVMGKGGWTGNSEWRGRSGEGRDREAFTTPPCNELM
ncbi:hypothetical protein BHM03_00039206 [Ensete ventricosum]|nr:hypothetical protein BHM03_00039206 [Ensete ventricosum]